MKSGHVLIVDDHRDIRETLADYLKKNGYRTSVAENAATARRLLQDHAIDLVILDIMMPGEDGLSFCRHLRATSALPVILLTAMADDTDRVIGLELGADDYVVKPFNPRELLARIKAVLRRTHSLPPQPRVPETERIRFDKWILDTRQRQLLDRNQVAIPISTSEFLLLHALLSHSQRVLSREQLLDLTQGRETKLFDRSIDNQISRLRRKIEDDPKNPKLIKTVRSGGYMCTATVEIL